MANELARLNVKLQLQNNQLLTKLEQSNRKITSFAQKSNRSLNTFRRAAVSSFKAVAVAAGGLSLGALGAGIVRTAAQFETLKISLRTVTGSAEAAQKAFADIQAFTASTPFQLQEVTEAFIKLQARGLDPSTESLRAYGNVAAGMSKSLDQFVEAVADAATGEFERLKEFGIIARTQGEEITFTFRGVSTVIRKEASAIEGYLKNIGNVDFAGATVDQIETFSGRVSNLKDALATLADQFATDSGLMSGLNRFYAFITDNIKAMTDEKAALTPFDQAIEATTKRIQFLKKEASKGRFTLFPGGNEEATQQVLQFSRLLTKLEDQRADFIAKVAGTPGSLTFVGPLPAATAGPAVKSPAGLSESEKSFAKWRATVIDVGRETEALQQKIDFLDDSLLAGTLTTEEHRIELEKLTGAQSVHVGEVEKSLETASDKVAEVSRGAIDMGFAFTSAFEDAVLEGEKFSDVLDGLLKDLQKVALRQLITAPAGNALSAGISRTFPGFASGGSFTVGGSGGTDSQLVAFNATPGERVAVSTPGNQVGSTTVNVVNNTGAQAEVKRSNDSNGRELINVIIGQVASNIAAGGQVAQAMQGVFGVRRQGIVRT